MGGTPPEPDKRFIVLYVRYMNGSTAPWLGTQYDWRIVDSTGLRHEDHLYCGGGAPLHGGQLLPGESFAGTIGITVLARDTRLTTVFAQQGRLIPAVWEFGTRSPSRAHRQPIAGRQWL